MISGSKAEVFTRRMRGQSSVEMVAGLLALMPIVLVLFDMVTVATGAQINDTISREAARVAASGDPGQALNRVNGYIAGANSHTKGAISSVSLANPGVVFDPPSISQQIQAPALVGYGGPIQGTVTVQTQVTVMPFVVQMANGGKPLVFNSSHTLPFTYVMPRTLAAGQ